MALHLEDFIEQATKRNKVSQAHKEVLARGIEMVKRCHAEGIYVLFTDGLRTGVDQAILFGKGRPSNKNPKSTQCTVYNGVDYANPKVKKVTNARPGTSFHNYGLALDFVLTDADAKQIFWNRDKKWERAAAIAKELGFTWGGDWKGFVDNPHIQYDGGLTLAQIKAGKSPVFKPFNKTKKEDDEMKFSSPALQAETEFSLASRAHREFIVKTAIAHGANEKVWTEKLENNTLTEGDLAGLAIKAVVGFNKGEK